MIAELRNLETVAVEHGAALRGEINIGLQTVTVLEDVAQVLVAFKANHPLVNIRITEGVLPDLLASSGVDDWTSSMVECNQAFAKLA